MRSEEFPLIISPNLGCPEIVSIEELKKGKLITLIIAGQYGEFISPLRETFEDALFIQPSDGEQLKIPFTIASEPAEITDWNLLSEFSNAWTTREIINSELHYKVFGEETRYWKIDVSLRCDHAILVRKNGSQSLPKLFDLVLTGKSKKMKNINYHALQFVTDFTKEFVFIHITDLHTAKRNDEILDEVLKVKCTRSRNEIENNYLNFNQKLREFIHIANEMADKGELDFVVITGDLVDFASLGWDEEPNTAENNWKTFFNVIIGAGTEKIKGNEGIKVAVFTATGNHDWRLHPYDPNLGDYNESYGLEKEELKHYAYKCFDSVEYPEDERAKLSKAIVSKAFNKLNVDAFTDKMKVKFSKYLFTKFMTRILGATFALGGAGFISYTRKFTYVLIIAVVGILLWWLKKIAEQKLHKFADFIVDNPLHAEASALHFYLKHINSYLDYAFRYGAHTFIVMDTGADVFIGKLLDGKEIRHLKKMSIQDNVLGGSPDSRAFDSEQNYYNWSQIVWLEKVLSCLNPKNTKTSSRIFIFLHAPPINPREEKDFKWSNLWESRRKNPKWIPEDECNMTYGSINHYLSQFFYLCLGYRESELVDATIKPSLRNVDLVFSGHAHKNIEFRIKKDKNNEIRIFSEVYSQLLDADNASDWWRNKKPVIVQTAACGLRGKTDTDPPYFRKVIVNNKGQVVDFRVRNNKGIVKF